MIQQDNKTPEKFIASVSRQVIEGHSALFAHIATIIAYHYLPPRIAEVSQRSEKIWAGQVVIDNDKGKLFSVRINNEIVGQVRAGGKEKAISPNLSQRLNIIDAFEPIESEQGYAHVVAIFQDQGDGKMDSKILYHNLEKLGKLYVEQHAPQDGVTRLTMKPCESCRKLFVLDSNRSGKKFCSITCREREKKRRQRAASRD